MKRFYSLAILSLIANLIFIQSGFGQAVGDYRSNGNGNWNTNTGNHWQRWNGTTWVSNPSQGYPGQNSGTGAVSIIGSDQTTITASVPNAIGSLTIGDGSSTNELVTFSGTSAFTLSVTGDVILNDGNLTVTNQNGSKIHTLNVGGDFTVGSSSTFSGFASVGDELNVVLDGTGTQTIGGTISSILFQELTINKPSGGVSLGTDIAINGTTLAGTLTFTSGVLTTSATNGLTFNDNALVSGANDISYVDGPVIKIGNDAFTFPVGAGGGYHPISISAPGASTTFSAQFFRGSAYNLANIDPLSGIQAISQCEYWDLSRTAGSSNVDVTIGWTPSSPCGGGTSYVNNPPLGLTVSWLDTTPNPDLWKKATGGGGTTITGTGGVGGSGTVKQTGVTSYGNFVLASNLVGGSPLPVKLGIFRAYQKQSGVQIDWTTYSEMNVSHFEIERSSDGISFATIGQVAAKNFIAGSAYNWFDAAPLSGNNFYRIKTVDIDNKIEISSIVRINLGKSIGGIAIYPNPVRSGERISFQASDMQQGVYYISIYDNAGRRLYMQSFTHSGGAVSQSIQLPSSIRPGMYTIQFLNGDSKISKPFIVQ